MNMKDIPVFVGTTEPCVPESMRGDKIEMDNMQSCRIPALLTAGNTVIAAADKANCGADWGFIEIAVRLSEDSGKTFGKLNTIFTPPARIAPKNGEEYTSAFAIDPVMARAKDGSVIMMFDFYPECKGLHKANLLVKSNGYLNKGGKYLRKLLDSDGKLYLVHEDGFVYTEKGDKTCYYLPKNHNPEYNYQTVGDLYSTEGEPEFLTEYPPLFPNNTRDKYVGNIFLKNTVESGDSAFKRKAENCGYDCIESSPAPLTVPTTSSLFCMKSYDEGKTWSQPVDITPQVKTDSDKPFFGVGPGVGVTTADGRVIIPVYSVGTAYIIYSDDSGETWHRTDACKNIDECQLAVYGDGVIGCFGRPTVAGKMPYSVSFDNGVTWRKEKCGLYISRCQHSILLLPKNCYTSEMDKNKDYIICSAPSGHKCLDASRTDGRVVLGEVQSNHNIKWIKEIYIKTDKIYENSKQYVDFYAYSCLAVLPNGKIGLLYEAFPGGYIAFKSFSVSDFYSVGQDCTPIVRFKFLKKLIQKKS